MPRGLIKKKIIYADFFKHVLKDECKSSIRKLGAAEEVCCNERTIRRALKEGRMSERILDSIARFLDVDPYYLSGEKIEKIKKEGHYELSKNSLCKETNPYIIYGSEKFNKVGIVEHFAGILNDFKIDYKELDKMSAEKKLLFAKDFLSAVFPIVCDYFPMNSYGKDTAIDSYYVISNIENAIEDLPLFEYADTTLRTKYKYNPPQGYSQKQIMEMDASDLLFLEYNNQYPPSVKPSRFDNK